MTLPRENIYRLIDEERAEQDEKFGQQDHDDFVWLAILQEEVGETAQAILEARFRYDGTDSDMRAELVQVAAVAVAWLEALER